MAWKGLKLTADGQNALSAAQAAQKLNIRSVAVGDGALAGESHELKGLVNQLYEIEELEIVLKDAVCMITAELPEKEYEYCFREIGVMVETDDGVKLYAYDNCGDEAQQVVPGTGNATVKRRVRLTLTVANVAEVTVTNPAVMYVTYDDFQEAMGKKVDAEDGKGLSSNDFTDQDKEAVDGLGGLKFGQDAEGNWGYTAPDTEELVPFRSASGENQELIVYTYTEETLDGRGGTVICSVNSSNFNLQRSYMEILYSAAGDYKKGNNVKLTTGKILMNGINATKLLLVFFDQIEGAIYSREVYVGFGTESNNIDVIGNSCYKHLLTDGTSNSYNPDHCVPYQIIFYPQK